MTCSKNNMATEKKNMDYILYNLLVHAEWPLEGEVLNKDSHLSILQKRGSFRQKLLTLIKGSAFGLWLILKYPFRGVTVSHGLPKELSQLYESSECWHFLLSSDGKYVAILQDIYIEIRSVRNNFATVTSKFQVHKDEYPKWRRMAWSSDSSLLAFAHSWGEVVVFDLSGTSLFSIKDSSLSGVYHGPSMFLHNKSISGLLFLDEDKMNPGLTELLVISYKGQINSYIINNRSGEHTKKCSFSFQSVLSQGVSCALYYPSARLLILGSPSPCITGTSALGNCVTLWRLLSDKPYFKLVEDQALELSKRRQESGIISKLLPGRSTNKQHGVWKMSLSPDGKMLLVLHIAGRLALWQMPSMTLLESWERDEVPEYKCEDLHMAARHSKVLQKELIYDIGWWSDNAMILARRSGALTVSTADRSLRNILGQYAEWCEPLPLVTSISDGGFLILECENNVVTLSPARKSAMNEGEQGTHEDDEEEDEHHIVTKARELTKHILYFLTESERFRSQIRRPKIAKKVYRLLCLRSTTPEELYARKIELEEYGEALALAQSYNLDCDFVYQKQWRKSPVTVSSIHDYLSKVTKRIWVLHECLERVAEDIDSTKALLKYGLYNTGLHVLASMGNMDNPFLKEKDDDDEVEASDDRENEGKLLKTINFNNLSVEQRNLCRYRLRFLKYLDRLSTYEAILGGPAFAHDSFDSTFFTNFRDSNIVDVAVDFARDNDWNAVDFLLTYHGEDALPHYLSIISNFPETTNPYVYRTLLPEAGIDENEPEIYKWEQKTWRTLDWVEDSKFSKICPTYVDVDLGNNLYEENVKLKIFSGALDAVKLTEWFKYRANEIERLSGQIDNALQLVKLGKEKGVKGLNTLLIDLSTMSTLIYECQNESSIDLETFEKLSNLEKMDLLLAKSSDATFVEDFKRWVIPFLDNVEKQTRGGKMKLIQQYMTETAKSNIAYPLKILQQSVCESKEPFIPDVARQMKLAMDCIYLCQREDQLDKAEEILRLFPSSSEGIMSQQIMALRTKLSETATYLRGTRILCDNDVPKPVSFLVNSRADEEAARSVMTNLSRKAQHREPPLKPSQWDKLLSDMLKLRHEIFTCIVPSVCYEAFLDCLITSGSLENINHAKRLLSSKPDVDSISKKIDQTKLIELVVKASREYFNSANNARDSCIHLAKACLALVPNSEHSVKEETDLICALSMLTDYKVSILPLQVRLCQDKLNLIEKVLDSSPHSYKDAGKLLNLASLLRLSGSDENTRRGRVLRLVAQRAMDHDDFDVSYNACAELIKSAYVPGWKICRALGEKIEFANLKARQKLLNFALAHCEPGVMETVLHARSLLRTQIVYGELGGLLENVGDTSQLDTDLTTTEQISKTTKSILSSVSDVGWWADTLQWVRPLAA